MILVILAICIVAVTFGCILRDSYDFENLGLTLCIVGGTSTIISIIATIILGITVRQLGVIDQKIAMYEEENTKIETQIAEMVEQYQQYETDIFTEVKPESSMTLVSLYPELKSDTLVQSQIEVHTANNHKIKELKETQIDGPVYRWWLYFGG